MFKDITLGQYYQTDSLLHRLDPRVKLVGTLVYIISLFVVDSFTGYIIAGIFLAAMIVLSNVPVGYIVRGMRAILILDEPTAGLDPKGRDSILGMISDMKKKLNMTIILVSHSMDDVARYVDRIMVMGGGKLLYDDEPVKVFRHVQELENLGLAAPQITYIMKLLREKGLDVSTDALTVEEAAAEIMAHRRELHV